MASDRQIAANRANARRSTGPRTPGGKARSRRNALKHGLTGKTVAVQWGECPEEFEELRQELIEDFQPQTALGCEIINDLTCVTWQLRRVQRLENAVFDITMMKVVMDNNEIMTRHFKHDRERVTKLQEAGIELVSANLETAVQSGATYDLFGSDPIEALKRYRTDLQRQRQRLLDQFEQVERIKLRSR